MKELEWVGSAKKDLKALPEAVQDIFGYALFLAQAGGKHHQAKPPGLWVRWRARSG